MANAKRKMHPKKDTSRPETKRSGLLGRKSAATVVAIAAMAVAAISVGFQVYDGVCTRRHERLSVRPFLQLSVFASPGPDDDFGVGIYLKNDGLGTALAPGFVIDLDGTEIGPEALILVLEHMLQEHSIAKENVVTARALPHAIAPGEVYTIVHLPSEYADIEVQRKFYALFTEPTYTISYESLYGERWEYDIEAPVIRTSTELTGDIGDG